MWSAAARMSSSVIRVNQRQTSAALLASALPLPPVHRVVTTARMQICTDTNGIGSDSSMIATNDRSISAAKKPFCTATTIEEVEEDANTASTSSSTAAMEDEYGEMTAEGESYLHPEPFVLESGQILPHATLKYQTYGTLNEAKDNVLVVCHALTGNASLHTWWGDMLGPDRPFDTNKYFIVCSNILGSCYGSTSPRSRCPYKNTFYGMDFPDVSVQDTVRLQLHMLQEELGVQSVKSVIGGSFGGMQAVEYAAQAGIQGSDSFLRSVIPIACGAAHTAWQIGISEVQRQAIYADPNWRGGSVEHHLTNPPLTGLSVARQIGMVSYRTPRGYENKFGRGVVQHKNGETEHTPPPPPYGRYANWQVKSYLDYQGQKFLSRFDAITYVKLTEQMDSHDVGRNRGGKAEALSKVHIPALVIGIDSDILYPLHEQEELASLLPNAQLKIVNSDAGHDGFLLEQTQVGAYINEFLSSIK